MFLKLYIRNSYIVLSVFDIDYFEFEGLTLQQLRYFNAVAEGDTFADAAALIGISQSALSQGIARLEQVVGERLLERDGRRRRLTDAGELVAGYARRVLGESESLAADLDSRRSGRTGRLRLGLIDAAALYLFRDRLSRFRADHPGIELSIMVAGSDELEEALVDFRIDIAVMIGPTRTTAAALLATEPMHLYGNPGPISDRTWALYPTGSRTRAAIDAGLAEAGIEPRVAVESGNPAVLRELAALTGSLTVLPPDVADQTPLNRVMNDVATRDVLIAARSDPAVAPPARAFIAAMTARG